MATAFALSFIVTFTIIPLILCKKLTGTANYSTWAIVVQFQFQGQGRVDHLRTKLTDVPTNNKACWKQIDTSLCNVLWFSLGPTLQARYQAFTICYDVWTKAKKVYSNNVCRFYSVITNQMNIKIENMDMQAYLLVS